MQTIYQSWGLNNYGQLGIGGLENQYLPQQIEEFNDLDIISFQGGQHHSLALTSDGRVFAWGKNDDAQLGLGEDWIDIHKEQIDAQNEEQKLLKQTKFGSARAKKTKKTTPSSKSVPESTK